MRIRQILLLAVAVFSWCVSGVHAGGGPHNVMLVINANSPASKSIANEYIALRSIPARNVVYLDRVPTRQVIPVGEFRERILQAVLDAIAKRGLADHIDYIVYSADFPTAITIGDEAAPFLKSVGANAQAFKPMASINAMTFYADPVMAKNPGFMALTSNWYMRQEVKQILATPFVGADQDKYRSAVARYRAGKYDEAIAVLQTLHKQHPRQVAVSYALARAQAKQGQSEQALLSLLEAIRAGWCYRQQTLQDPAFADLTANRSFQRVVEQIPNHPYRLTPPMGFQRQYIWGANGFHNGLLQTGNRYYLSTVLAVIGGRGTSEAQALHALRQTVAADGSHPAGTVYYSQTKNVRSQTRSAEFRSAVDALKQLGVNAEIVKSVMPTEKANVAGASIGVGGFDWAASGSRIVPGAICENLTSFGGNMRSGKQTPLTEFIKFGAAGSSGTVTEPLAIAAKFPHPWIHVHYASGCSLGEAFYQSVHAPYQLLIVGDPLCQPWARFPQFTVKGLRPNATVNGSVTIETSIKANSPGIRHYEVYLDGLKGKRLFAPDEPIELDTTRLPDGAHELRIVAIGSGLIETQSSWVAPVTFDNGQDRIKLTLSGSRRVKLGRSIKLKVEADGANVEILQNFRKVAQIAGTRGEIEVAAEVLGRGMTKLVARYPIDGGWVYSEPVEVEIRH